MGGRERESFTSRRGNGWFVQVESGELTVPFTGKGNIVRFLSHVEIQGREKPWKNWVWECVRAQTLLKREGCY